MPKEYGVVEAEMLLEGGNLVKTWELEVIYHDTKFAFKTQPEAASGILWQDAQVVRAPRILKNQPGMMN